MGGAELSVQELRQQNHQQELIIKHQTSEIERMKNELRESRKEMEESLVTMRERQQAIVRKCQAAGLSIPQELLTDIKGSSSSSSFPLSQQRHQPSSTQQIISQSNSLLQQPSSLQNLILPRPISSTASSTVPSTSIAALGLPTSFSSSVMGSLPPAYSTISPTNRTPPPPPPLSVSRIPPGPTPPPPLIPPPPSRTHHPVGSIVTLSPACSVDSILNSSQINQQMMVGGGRGIMSNSTNNGRMLPHLPQQQQPHLQPSLMSMGGGAQLVPNRMMLGDHAQQHNRNHMASLPSRPPGFPTGKNVPANAGPMLLNDISFSPLTSSELNELDNPSGMGEIFVGSTLMPITEDLDSILNIPMPSGSGAGYGVGVKEEELSRESLQLDLK